MQSPLKPQWDRVLQIGDASGIQSPLSFGGFGAMTRHLARLRQAVLEALEVQTRSTRPTAHRTAHCYFAVIDATFHSEFRSAQHG